MKNIHDKVIFSQQEIVAVAASRNILEHSLPTKDNMNRLETVQEEQDDSSSLSKIDKALYYIQVKFFLLRQRKLMLRQ